MRVLFVANSTDLVAGVETQTKELALGLTKAGHEPIVLTQARCPVFAFIKQNKITVEAVSDGCLKKNPYLSQSADIIHWHRSRWLRFAIGHLAAPTIERLNMTRHEDFWYATRFKPYDLWSQSWIDHFVVVSNTLKSEFVKRGYNHNKLTTIYNGCDKVPQNEPIPSSEFHIGFIGRFVTQKGLDILFDALSIIDIQLCLTIAGAGPLEKFINLKISLCKTGHNIQIKNYQHNAKQFLSSLNCLIYPSRYEPFSNTILEAMSVGTPVIASRVGGNTEAIEHEQSGLLFENENPQALANAIMRMKTDKELRDRCILGGFEQLKKFSVENMVQGHLDLYEKLLREKR